jgi:hypothetical protein
MEIIMDFVKTDQFIMSTVLLPFDFMLIYLDELKDICIQYNDPIEQELNETYLEELLSFMLSNCNKALGDETSFRYLTDVLNILNNEYGMPHFTQDTLSRINEINEIIYEHLRFMLGEDILKFMITTEDYHLLPLDNMLVFDNLQIYEHAFTLTYHWIRKNIRGIVWKIDLVK